jgi:glutamate synthase domain-containing protein 1
VTHSATALSHPQRRTRPTEPVGLYDPAFEHDSCGVAFVARLNREPSHETLERALRALENLEHRGAAGADPLTGDGAGMLLQLPDEFFRAVAGRELPPAGSYGVCVAFLPRGEEERRAELEHILETAVEEEGQRVLCWRDVPMELEHIGNSAREAAPIVRQS